MVRENNEIMRFGSVWEAGFKEDITPSVGFAKKRFSLLRRLLFRSKFHQAILHYTPSCVTMCNDVYIIIVCLKGE
jgi:hypothetical protein